MNRRWKSLVQGIKNIREWNFEWFNFINNDDFRIVED